jgi:transposase
MELAVARFGDRPYRTNTNLAWLWLRHQPDSRLAAWYRDRVTSAKGRLRRIAIVALARKLVVAALPDGMTHSPITYSK